ncbi:MAG: carboxy terminal-processing peptidase [Saprospiraceae bacterium]|nr:carboxy terminal-processing peptidase [Saprospiraceae bacterium]
MHFRSSLVIVALFGLLFFRMSHQEVAVSDKEGLILQGILQSIESVHFNPKAVDDNFSKHVYKTYLERLDNGKRFLTQKDIDQLKKYEEKLDDQAKLRTFEFFNESLPLLENGIQKAESYFNEIIDGKLDFDNDGTLETDGEKRQYAKNDADLKKYWKEVVEFEVMSRYVSTLNDQKEKTDKADLKTDAELKSDAVKEIKKRFSDWFVRLSKLRRTDRLEIYFASICNYFDPHTDYFSPKEKQDFDINMGGQIEGIGARLQTDGDYTKVASVVVGGPAWKTKKLEDDDVILKVTQKGQEPVDISGMRIDDVVQLVRGKKGTTVILTVRKKDNSVIDIEIEREKVQLDESKAKSMIISLDGKINNIGYLHLPKFYSTFDGEGGNSCAYDVAQELKKLKNANVNGVILDLRNNSGGSLNDVVDMSGFFIKEGPIVQVKSREGKPYLHQDKDAGVLYDGPLIIMVNHFSASASEIIAAAMQDYNRAIVVGSNSTFGKGTVQRFYDLDRGIRGFDELKPLGNIKMTVQKFYRVNGGSTQLRGVIPDIILPDNYQFIQTGEKEYGNALEWTEIEPVNFLQDVVKLEHKEALVQNSGKRIVLNENFQLVLESAKRIKENRDQTMYPKKLDKYMSFVDKKAAESKKFEKVGEKEIAGMKLVNLSEDLLKINLDESNKARNEEYIKDLKKDFYLEETLLIMRDMIKMEKSFAAQQKKIEFSEN